MYDNNVVKVGPESLIAHLDRLATTWSDSVWRRLTNDRHFVCVTGWLPAGNTRPRREPDSSCETGPSWAGWRVWQRWYHVMLCSVYYLFILLHMATTEGPWHGWKFLALGGAFISLYKRAMAEPWINADRGLTEPWLKPVRNLYLDAIIVAT